MMLASWSRFSFVGNDTPIHALSNLNKQLKDVEIFIKRDDAMPMGLGGNKLRKLEYLLADAKKQGCDVLLTVGGIQSNHARLTAVTAAHIGMDCELVLTQAVPIDDHTYQQNGNVLLEELLDVKVHRLDKGETAISFVEKRKEELIAAGRKPYIVPLGGSSVIGCLGYVSCLEEILRQMDTQQLNCDTIVIPNGSGGTHAGLLAGVKLHGLSKPTVKSYTVLAPVEKARKDTFDKTKAVLELLQSAAVLKEADVQIDPHYLGEGYGIPTKEMVAALKLLAKTEGIFLDPVYSGKAFAGLINDIQKGLYPAGSKILFIHTGGVPGLFAYGNSL